MVFERGSHSISLAGLQPCASLPLGRCVSPHSPCVLKVLRRLDDNSLSHNDSIGPDRVSGGAEDALLLRTPKTLSSWDLTSIGACASMKPGT